MTAENAVPVFGRAQRLSASKIGSLGWPPFTVQEKSVLNACRRQRSVHLMCRVQLHATGKCAQRLSASKIGSRRDVRLAHTKYNVLNACRRQRSVHLADFLRSVPWRGCAQRLSASKIGSPAWSVASLAVGEWCSTPVGVKDRFTRRTRSSHRRRRSAQRLSASKIGSHTSYCVRPNCTTRAQRLSASKIGSPTRLGLSLISWRVLNACRRQRSVHLAAVYDVYLGSQVLNACRRQRSVHAIRPSGHPAIRRAQRLSASKIGSPW